MKLERLTVHRWRSLAEPVTLEFHDRINVVLGRNGTGKTNLLEAIAAAVGLHFPDEVLDVDAWYRLGERTAHLRVAAEPAENRQLRRWLLKCEVEGEDSIDLSWEGAGGPQSIVLPGLFVSPWPAVRFDESLGRWDSIGSSSVSISIAQGGWSPQRWLPYEMMQALVKAREGGSLHDLHLRRGGWSVLDQFAELIGAEDVRLAAALSEVKNGLAEFRGFELFVEYDADLQVAGNLLSFGEKRLFAFLWHCAFGPSDPMGTPEALVIDELTNGMHHSWIDTCLEAIGDRQSFIAVQNPLLLDFLQFETAEELRKSFVLCERAPAGATGRWRWHQLGEADAVELLEGWKAGWEHLSELLITRGVW